MNVTEYHEQCIAGKELSEEFGYKSERVAEQLIRSKRKTYSRPHTTTTTKSVLKQEMWNRRNFSWLHSSLGWTDVNMERWWRSSAMINPRDNKHKRRQSQNYRPWWRRGKRRNPHCTGPMRGWVLTTSWTTTMATDVLPEMATHRQAAAMHHMTA